MLQSIYFFITRTPPPHDIIDWFSMVCTRPGWVVDSIPHIFHTSTCLCLQLIDLNVCTRLFIWMLRNIFDTKKATFSWVLIICTFLAQIVELRVFMQKVLKFFATHLLFECALACSFWWVPPLPPKMWRCPPDSQCPSPYLKNGLYKCKDILICLSVSH